MHIISRVNATFIGKRIYGILRCLSRHNHERRENRVLVSEPYGTLCGRRKDQYVHGQYIYQIGSGPRPELATDPEAWSADDEQIGVDHYEYLRAATEDGVVILAGRSQDGIGPAIVIFEAESPEAANAFMEADPFVSTGLFTASVHPFNVALQRVDSRDHGSNSNPWVD